jgi:molybdopterin biosynthesis enzyme
VRSIALSLKRRVASVPSRHQIYTVRIVDGMAEPAVKASGDITSMSQADGYIEIAADVEAVDAGTPVHVTLF